MCVVVVEDSVGVLSLQQAHGRNGRHGKGQTGIHAWGSYDDAMIAEQSQREMRPLRGEEWRGAIPVVCRLNGHTTHKGQKEGRGLLFSLLFCPPLLPLPLLLPLLLPSLIPPFLSSTPLHFVITLSRTKQSRARPFILSVTVPKLYL